MSGTDHDPSDEGDGPPMHPAFGFDPKLHDVPEWQRLANALRRAAHASLDANGDPATLDRLATQAEALAEEIEAIATGNPLPLFAMVDFEGDLGRIIPFSPVMGRLNPIAPPISIRRDGDRVISEVTLNSAYQGANGIVHGAVIAGIYDEVLAMANLVAGTPGPTGKLEVRYRKPTPIRTPLRFEAWLDRADERKVFTHGTCHANGELVSEAEGLFIRINPDKPNARWVDGTGQADRFSGKD